MSLRKRNLSWVFAIVIILILTYPANFVFIMVLSGDSILNLSRSLGFYSDPDFQDLPRIKFNSDLWKQAGEKRLNMVNDLLEVETLKRKSKNELKELLLSSGESFYECFDNFNDLCYGLPQTFVAGLNMQDHWLQIHFDSEGKVSDYELVHGNIRKVE